MILSVYIQGVQLIKQMRAFLWCLNKAACTFRLFVKCILFMRNQKRVSVCCKQDRVRGKSDRGKSDYLKLKSPSGIWFSNFFWVRLFPWTSHCLKITWVIFHTHVEVTCTGRSCSTSCFFFRRRGHQPYISQKMSPRISWNWRNFDLGVKFLCVEWFQVTFDV